MQEKSMKNCFHKVFSLMALAVLAVPSGVFAQQITVYVNRIDLVSNGSYARWVKAFEASHPAIKVNIQGIPDYEAAMQKRFAERNFGDVVLVPRNMPKQVYEKYFIPLNDMQIENRIYFPRNWEFAGNHYAYTQGVIAEGLVYNKRLLAANGINAGPATLDELMQAAQQLNKGGMVALALNIGAAWPLQQWEKAAIAISGNGHYYDEMVKDERPFAKGKPYYESLRIAHQLFTTALSEKDFINNQWESSKVSFIENKIAMLYLGNWVIPQLIEAGMKGDDIGFVPFPFDNSGAPKGVLTSDWGLAVSRYSKNPQAAKAWIKFILLQSDFADVAGFIPTDKQRLSQLPQLAHYLSVAPQAIEMAPISNDFIRLTNKAGMDFMGGDYIRDIILSPDFEGSMAYWNRRWAQAKANLQGDQDE
jgi:raffinose/stachyose/melibiose transport system substrate-binding protein